MDSDNEKLRLSPRRPSLGSDDNETKNIELSRLGSRFRNLSCETSTPRLDGGSGIGKKSTIKRRGSYGAIQMQKIISGGDKKDVQAFIKSKVYDIVREENMSMMHIAALTSAKIHLKREQEKKIKAFGPYVLIPGSKSFFWWDVIVLLSIAFTVIFAPLQIVMDEPYGPTGSASFYIRFLVDRLIDFVFLTDVALHFRTAKVTQGGSIMFDATETARKYLRGRFVFDLLVAWPWDMIVLAILGGHANGSCFRSCLCATLSLSLSLS